MRKIRIMEHISLDGVIQAPGGPEEDSSGGGFKYGGWAAPHYDPEGAAAIANRLRLSFAPVREEPPPLERAFPDFRIDF